MKAFLRALDIQLATLGERHPDVASSHNNMGAVYLDLGDPARAVEAFLRALDIRLATLGECHHLVADVHYNISLAYRELGRPAQALEACESTLVALGTIHSNLTPKALMLRGQLSESRPGPDPILGIRSALSDYREAADALDRIRDYVLRDEDKIHQGEYAAKLFPLAIGASTRLAVASGSSAPRQEALSFAERGSARVFLDGLGRSRASAGGRVDPATLAEEARLTAEIRELDGRIAREQGKPFEKRDREEVERLFFDRKRAEEAWKALITRMEQESPQYAALKRPRPCSIAEARACLADDEVALLYVLGPEESCLVVVSPLNETAARDLAVHKLPPSGTIAEMVAALTQARVLEDADATRERGEATYKMLLAPAAGAIAGKRLVIVPGGVLGQLPFELLAEPGGQGGTRFLVQGHSIRYAPSLTALHHIRRWEGERPQNERTLWALGDPVYSPTDSRLANAVEP